MFPKETEQKTWEQTDAQKSNIKQPQQISHLPQCGSHGRKCLGRASASASAFRFMATSKSELDSKARDDARKECMYN